MTRKESVEYCSLCKNRKMDEEKGLVCGLTNNYADFESECKDFKRDEYEMEIRNLQKRKYNSNAIITVLCVIIAIIWIPAIFVMIDVPSSAGQMFILLLSVTGTLAALFSVFWVVAVVKFNKKTNGKLTLEKIMDCIRKEGYYPQKQDDEHIVFKIQGLSIDVYYYADTQYFQLQIKYLINNEQQMPAVEKAALYTMSRIWLIKIVTRQVEENNGLIFSVEGFTSSFSEFEKFFQTYMSILFDALGLYREYFNKISEEQHEDEAPRPKIGFPTSSSNIKS